MSQLYYRNENQSFMSNFAFEFIKKTKKTKNEMTL